MGPAARGDFLNEYVPELNKLSERLLLRFLKAPIDVSPNKRAQTSAMRS